VHIKLKDSDLAAEVTRSLFDTARQYRESFEWTMIEDEKHLSFTQGGGHAGSHPHLVHELVSALREGREPYPNARQAARGRTCPTGPSWDRARYAYPRSSLIHAIHVSAW
jgi:hypothetical protein